MVMAIRPIFLAIGLAVPLAAATAQTGAAPGRLRGQVADSLGFPIPGASVLVLGTSLTATTDSDGLFRFNRLPPKGYSILVRAIGWKPIVFELTVKTGEEWIGRIGLEPAAPRLPDLSITARPDKPAKYANTTRFDDFYRRRKYGLGHYLTRDQVDAAISSGAGSVGNLMERMNIPGVRFNNGDYSFERCKKGQGKVGVWIDGAKVPGSGYMPDIGTLINVRDIEAIEVYRGVAQIPGEFLDGSCAAIVVWTKYN
jgi:hypothetical protein